VKQKPEPTFLSIVLDENDRLREQLKDARRQLRAARPALLDARLAKLGITPKPRKRFLTAEEEAREIRWLTANRYGR
jgi:hypothetical protein